MKLKRTIYCATELGVSLICALGMLIGISLIFPAFRRMYYKLPWLFPLVKILFINVVITSIAHIVMNFGYGVRDETRHDIFFTLTISVIVVGRILMCLWFSKRKVEYIGKSFNV